VTTAREKADALGVVLPPDGLYAFPCHAEFTTPLGTVTTTTPGMLQRDYFAALAMQALATRMAMDVKSPDEIAVKAYELADAMLRARQVNP
jgi:hypothetical protein